jgi:hypothetical protein
LVSRYDQFQLVMHIKLSHHFIVLLLFGLNVWN